MKKGSEMRKLVFGIIFLGALITWVLYLHYDTKRFIQNLPQVPASRQEWQEIPARVTTAFIKLEPGDPVMDVWEKTPEIPANSPTNPTGTAARPPVFEDLFVEQVPEPDDTEFSPELEICFSVIRTLEKERLAVLTVVDQMRQENVSIMFRQQEISRELSNSPDSATEKALYKERTALLEREKELSPRIFELQDEYNNIKADRSAFLEQYDISSWQEFKEIHGDAYKTWKDKQ